MAYLTKRFHYLTKGNKLSSRRSGSNGSKLKDSKEDRNGCFNCKKTGHLIVDYISRVTEGQIRERKLWEENLQKEAQGESYDNLEELDEKAEADKDEEEENLGLMASLASDSESELDSDEKYNELLFLSKEGLIDNVKELASR